MRNRKGATGENNPPESRLVPAWFPVAGTIVLYVELAYFMVLAVVTMIFGSRLSYDGRQLLSIVLALGAAASAFFIGGSAVAKGSAPIRLFNGRPIAFGLTGGSAAFAIIWVMGYYLWVKGVAPELGPSPNGRGPTVEEVQHLGEELILKDPERIEILNATKAFAVKNGYSLEQVQRAVQDWTTQVISTRTNSASVARAYFIRDNLDAIAPSVKSETDEKTVRCAGIVLKRIPSGIFLMGSPVSEIGRDPDEGPQTQVTITYEYWIGKYEVTQAQYETARRRSGLLVENPSYFNGDRTSWNSRDFGHVPKRPVDNITWCEADAFCRVLTKIERGNIPTNFEYRLPTEAEWEYACRAGTVERFSFGNDESELGKYAWFKSNAVNRTQPVGQKMPNSWGLYDMHGNVMEWCFDWYATNLPGGAISDPIGPSSGTKRVLRGGGWESGFPREFRCADRFGLEPSSNGYAYGFRVVLGPNIASLRSLK